MATRIFRVVLARTRGGLTNAALASEGWTILQNTVKDFSEADSNDDQSLGNIGGIVVKQPGWVALAYREE